MIGKSPVHGKLSSNGSAIKVDQVNTITAQ